MGKVRVGIVFGGRSGEHEVSVRSAASIFCQLNRDKYEAVLVGVDKGGIWHLVSEKWLPTGPEMKSLPDGYSKPEVPTRELDIVELGGKKIDVFFPIVHGTYGEDGSLQGLFELLDVAYVGAGVLGSAVGMDKDVMKRLLLQAKIQVADYVVLRKGEKVGKVEFPVFVKPANMGSSVGISKAHDEAELQTAINEAFEYDTKVLIEEAVSGQEVECAVLGNEKPIASVVGEVIPRHEFYDYEAKYIDENGAELIIPARLSKKLADEVRKVAVRAYRVLECSGMARVDMFVTLGGKVVVNEINTLPGFTSISMYPKLWEASGVSYGELLDKLIQLAIEIKQTRDRLKRSY